MSTFVESGLGVTDSVFVTWMVDVLVFVGCVVLVKEGLGSGGVGVGD